MFIRTQSIFNHIVNKLTKCSRIYRPFLPLNLFEAQANMEHNEGCKQLDKINIWMKKRNIKIEVNVGASSRYKETIYRQ